MKKLTFRNTQHHSIFIIFSNYTSFNGLRIYEIISKDSFLLSFNIVIIVIITAYCSKYASKFSTKFGNNIGMRGLIYASKKGNILKKNYLFVRQLALQPMRWVIMRCEIYLQQRSLSILLKLSITKIWHVTLRRRITII